VITVIAFRFFIWREGKYREDYLWSILIIFMLSTSQPANCWPRSFAIKVFFAALFFYGLHINTAYRSYLIDVLQNPRYDTQISTVSEAIANGVTFTAGANSMVFFEKEDELSKYLNRSVVKCTNINHCFARLDVDKKLAVALSRAHANHNPMHLTEEDFYCFSVANDLFIYSAVMMFQRFHHLLPRINEKIRYISESGLLTKWVQDTERSRSKVSNKNKDGKASESVQMKLRVEHVEGAFLVVIIGLSIAFIAFCLEWLVYWLRNKRKNNSRFVVSLENVFCHAS